MQVSTYSNASADGSGGRRSGLILLLGVLLPSLLLLVNLYAQWGAVPFDAEAAKNVQATSLQMTFGEHKQWYLWINFGVIIFPFLLSFDKRVHFYRKWWAVMPAIAINAAFFLVWDVLYTRAGVWGFNDRYIDGMLLGLPYGEWLFFITVPYACVFVHECLTAYIRTDIFRSLDRWLTPALILLLLGIGLWQWQRLYTSWTFLLPAGMLAAHYIAIENTYRTRFYLSFLVCLLPFLLTNGILTGAFNQEPVVIYNDAHNLTSLIGSRFITIPYDDFAYGFLLIFVPVVVFEELRKRFA